MRVLITGASGFVGRAVARALVAADHEVRGLTREPSVGLDAGVQRLVGGIGDPRSLAEAARGCDAIVHAAGITSFRAPVRVLRWVHIAGTENVLQAARHVGVQRVVHMSCAEVSLCAVDRMHWNESRALPHDPVGSFARSKLMGEEIALAGSDPQLEVTALRPALIWGPGDVQGIARLRHEHAEGGVVAYAEGRNLVATAHIANLAQAVTQALTAQGVAGRAYYITDGEFIEAREVYARWLGAVGLPVKFRSRSLGAALFATRLRCSLGLADPNLEAEILRRGKSALFDLSSAARDLGYSPALDFDAQIAGLTAWVSAAGGLDAVVAQARPEPTQADVDAQVQLAGGD